MHDAFLFLSAFLASAVEMVEALTIVLAVGITRGWRSTLVGAATAFAALTALVALLGPALAAIPIDALRLVVGFLLLVFGLQWLRKAILRAGGYKAVHDETAAFREEVAEARAHERAGGGLDWFAFTLAFKGVFLEGLEVVFIVLTFGATQGSLPIAIAAAVAAVLIVAAVGAAVRAPLARVPENAMKFGVGAMLTTFGVFWSAEGAGVSWPGGDGAILGLLAFVLACSLGSVAVLRRLRARSLDTGPVPGAPGTAPLGSVP